MSYPRRHDQYWEEAGLLRSAGEKTIVTKDANPLPSSTPSAVKHQRQRMPTPLKFLLFTSVCLSLGFSLSRATQLKPRPCVEDQDVSLQAVEEQVTGGPDSSLSSLWRSASPEALHRLLHEYLPEKYQHGIFESDSQAFEALEGVRSASPLEKRQGDLGINNTTATTSSTSISSPPVAPPTTTTSRSNAFNPIPLWPLLDSNLTLLQAR